MNEKLMYLHNLKTLHFKFIGRYNRYKSMDLNENLEKLNDITDFNTKIIIQMNNFIPTLIHNIL